MVTLRMLLGERDGNLRVTSRYNAANRTPEPKNITLPLRSIDFSQSESLTARVQAKSQLGKK